jgi:recombination endonuclease VII
MKALDQFYRDAAGRDGHRPECKECTSSRRLTRYRANREAEIARVQGWQRENAEHVKAYQARYREQRDYRAEHLRRTFGMTQGDYDAMLLDQGGGCAICGRAPRPGKHLHVDHDHDTGRVRGLLCFSCNVGVGNFHHDTERIARAAEYLDDDPTRTELTSVARDRVRSLVRAGPD